MVHNVGSLIGFAGRWWLVLRLSEVLTGAGGYVSRWLLHLSWLELMWWALRVSVLLRLLCRLAWMSSSHAGLAFLGQMIWETKIESTMPVWSRLGSLSITSTVFCCSKQGQIWFILKETLLGQSTKRYASLWATLEAGYCTIYVNKEKPSEYWK